jgi:tyrosyl-DNA phosphodiesterase 2
MPDAIVPIRAVQYSRQHLSRQWRPIHHDADAQTEVENLPTSLTLITWNVDFSNDFAAQRLTAALDYLRDETFAEYKTADLPFCIILLQEIERGAFSALLAHLWVKEWFMVVPGRPGEGWPRGAWYGTATLVRKGEWLARSTCVHFGGSLMGRNALVTDVLLGGGYPGAEPHARVLRVVNTHLESLPEGAQSRVVQLGVITALLGEAEAGGIVGGDMNAIMPSDATLAAQNGLLDAWEEQRWDRGRREGSEEEEEGDGGMTWGYQPPCKFPPGRLDKILYTESDAFEVKGIRRLGVGLTTPYGGWVSDHYGLACQVEVRQTTSREAGL